MQGAVGLLASFLGVLFNKGGDTFNQRMLQATVNIALAPAQVFGLGLSRPIAAVLLGNRQQVICGLRGAEQHHIFHHIAQLCGQLVVNRQLAGINNTHA